MTKLKLRLRKDLKADEVVAQRDQRSPQCKAGNDSSNLLVSDERAVRALELRREQRMSIPMIAKEIGVSYSQARRYIYDYWAGLIENIAERQMVEVNEQLEMTDDMLEELQPLIKNEAVQLVTRDRKGGLVFLQDFERITKSCETALKVLHHRAQLLKLKQPEGDVDPASNKLTLEREILMMVYERSYQAPAEKEADAIEVG